MLNYRRLLSGRNGLLHRVGKSSKYEMSRFNTFRCLSSSDSSSKSGKGKSSSKYSHTVLLPSTTFNQRANSLKRDPEIQKFWNDNKIYEKLYKNNHGKVFTLHDGPPYANGDLHIGHALNKILKDFINKYYILKGNKVKYIPYVVINDRKF